MDIAIKENLEKYFHLYRKFQELGGPGEAGELYEEVFGLEEDILGQFGLPPSDRNSKILWKFAGKSKLTDKSLQQILEHLQAAAERHLFAPVLTDLEQLEKGQAQERSAFDVLPEMGYPTHDYPIFLYEEVLSIASPKEVLAELCALKRLDCYGDLYNLKKNFPRTFRKTKVYKSLASYLKFLDHYLEFDEDKPLFLFEETTENHPLMKKSETVVMSAEWDENEKRALTDLFANLPSQPPVDFKPEYSVLSDVVYIEEIIFSRDSAVTVVGKIQPCYRTVEITLGFELQALADILRSYRQQGQQILNYFDRNHHQNGLDYPLSLNLKDMMGSELGLNLHYFKVYKPLSLDREGNPGPMEESFYIVEEVIDKVRYDQEKVRDAKANLDGCFSHMRNHYYGYLNAKHDGMGEEEARRENGIEEPVRFEVSKLLYTVWKHGGQMWD